MAGKMRTIQTGVGPEGNLVFIYNVNTGLQRDAALLFCTNNHCKREQTLENTFEMVNGQHSITSPQK